jgi:hypothetical protein
MNPNSEESLHTGVTKDPASTPGYFRMLLAALPTRYALRGVITFFKEWPAIGWVENRILGIPKKMEPFRDYLKGEANAMSQAEIMRRAHLYDPHISAEKLELWRGSPIERKNGLSLLHKEVRDRVLDSHYDNMLGVGSAIITALYAMRVKTDIWHAFAETVAYENGKNPRDITSYDIMRSDNSIVQGTVRNYLQKTFGRFATDAIFFGRQLAHIPGAHPGIKSVPFGELGIGVKGYFLLRDILAKQTSFFEDLTQLIDKKLNPIKGIGEPISSSDVIDLYQKYALRHNQNAAFKDALIRERRDGVDWPKAERLFSRVADLMNQTYKYKHSSIDHVSYENRELQATSDFALPKFLYLLGHGLIDPRRPEQSLAYVELANRQGIEAVKAVRQHVASGAAFVEAVCPYGAEYIALVSSPEPVPSASDKVVPITANQNSPASSTSAPETVVRGGGTTERLQSSQQMAPSILS